MKRVALPFLVLAGLALLVIGLRQASENDVGEGVEAAGSDAAGSDPPSRSVEGGRASSVRAPGENPRAPGGRPADEDQQRVGRSASVSDPASEPLEDLALELPLETSPTEERAPLKRFADGDALALRRARQIELVTQAQEQAHEALEDAEASGDTESAARTRGVLRRLQLRLDALETAASALEPY